MIQNEKTRRLVLAAMFCALTFLGTCLAVPAPVVGNLNFGDGVLLICAWTLGLPWGLAAAVGAALSDFALGYSIYIPATLVIKALMVVTAVLLRRILSAAPLPRLLPKIGSAVCAELVMAAGYYLYESLVVLGSFQAALANIPFNLIQALFAVILSCVITARERKA